MVGRGPSIEKGSCPTCNHPFGVPFYEGQNVQRFFCDRCTQWVTAELKDGKLEVSTKDASYTPIRRNEVCPNAKCKTPWELWFHQNKALAKAHGARIVAGNLVQCNKDGTHATVSLD